LADHDPIISEATIPIVVDIVGAMVPACVTARTKCSSDGVPVRDWDHAVELGPNRVIAPADVIAQIANVAGASAVRRC
jgi:hypothetical protein